MGLCRRLHHHRQHPHPLPLQPDGHRGRRERFLPDRAGPGHPPEVPGPRGPGRAAGGGERGRLRPGSSASAIATMVVAQAGGLVSSEFQQWSSGPTGGMSLRLGSPSAIDHLAAGPDHGHAPVHREPVPGQSGAEPGDGHHHPGPLVRLGACPTGSWCLRYPSWPSPRRGPRGSPSRRPYALTVTSTAPIVVGRSVQAPSGSPRRRCGARRRPPPPWPPDGWCPVPESPARRPHRRHRASLAVANPGTTAARVEVTRLGSNTPVAMFTVAPGRVVVLGPKQVGRPRHPHGVGHPARVRRGGQPPAGTPGVVSSSGFPLDSLGQATDGLRGQRPTRSPYWPSGMASHHWHHHSAPTRMRSLGCQQ